MLFGGFLVVLLASTVRCMDTSESTVKPSGSTDHGKHKEAFHWGYHSMGAPDHWEEHFPICKGDNSRQSPINIPSRQTGYDESLEPIDLSVAKYREDERFVMKNNGHTVNVRVPSDIYVQGGSLGDIYKVASLHFHWGKDSSHGSEHSLNSKHYPLEMHMVTYDSEKYDGLIAAVNGDNSLAVLGTFFEISETDNTAFNGITNYLNQTKYPTNTVTLPYMDLNDLLPKNTGEFYRYEGSLTTPPCYQSVVWTVFEQTQTISESQMQKFRSLLENHPENPAEEVKLVDNYRPLQQLQKRKITRSFRFDSEISYNGGQGNVKQHGEGVNAGNSLHSNSVLSLAMASLSVLVMMLFSMGK